MQCRGEKGYVLIFFEISFDVIWVLLLELCVKT